MSVNGHGPVAIARACVQAGVRRYVFLSSVKALAERSTHPLPVAAPSAAEDAYGRAKHAAETGIAAVSAQSGLDAVILRCPLVYGADAKGNLGLLRRAVELGIPLPFKSIRNCRSLVAVDALADAIAHAALRDGRLAGTYHVADARAYSTAEITALTGRLAGLQVKLVSCPPWLVRWPLQLVGGRGLVDRLFGSLELETAESFARLGWYPPATPQ